MSTTARQTWVRRAGRYFTDSVPGHTHRVSPALGTVWAVHRLAYGEGNDWEFVSSHSSLAQAKAAALADL